MYNVTLKEFVANIESIGYRKLNDEDDNRIVWRKKDSFVEYGYGLTKDYELCCYMYVKKKDGQYIRKANLADYQEVWEWIKALTECELDD